MLKNYYTLVHIVNELQSIKGFVIVDSFTQSKDMLYIQIYDGKNSFKTLQFSCLTNFEAIFLRNYFERKRSNSTEIFPHIIGNKILGIELFDGNRIIKMQLNEFGLYFFLFGGSRNNAFLVSKSGSIVQSFQKSKEYSGKSINEILTFVDKESSLTIFDYLSKQKFLGKVYTELILKEINLDRNKRIIEIDNGSLEKIELFVENFIQKLLSSNEYYVFSTQGGYLLSLIPLPNTELQKTFKSVSEAVFYRFVNSLMSKEFFDEVKRLKAFFENKIKFYKAKIDETIFNEEIRKRAVLYRNYGDLLLSQTDLKVKGKNEIHLLDFEGNPVIIPLKSELNLAENATIYYEKSKKLRERLNFFDLQKDKILNKMELNEKALVDLQNVKNFDELKDFKMKAKELIKEREIEKQGNTFESRFRKFVLSEDAILFVGKSAENNDELTFGFAKPNDFWFHARGVGGSHCVLKYLKGKNPKKELIEKCGQIAAYFSKARDSKFVPVSYTQKKYVRKPKGAPPGTVLLEREQVVFVTPKAPEISLE